MNAKFSFPILFISLFFFQCATVPLPMPTIPRQEKEIISSFSAGSNGLNLNLGYVTKSKIVFNVSLQHQFLISNSNVYDLGLGAIGKQNKFMGVLSFGYGRHEVYPITMGLNGAVYQINVDAFRMGAYMSFGLSEHVFLNIRSSLYWGDQTHKNIGNSFVAGRDFESYALEPAMFFRFGNHKHLLFGLGGHLVKEKMNSWSEKYFNPWPLWIGFGYQLERKL